jgi:Ca-activated chloride channel family protein
MRMRRFGLLTLGAALAVTVSAQFKSDVRLVEVYASVFDQKGNHVDGLTKDRFRVLDEGALQPLSSFESESSDLTCALLLDTTGSMQGALPSVKNAVSNLLAQMPEGDSVGIFGFSTSLVTLQDFTTDRAAAKRAVLRTRAAGQTALFDAIADVARNIGARTGKKAIVLFTDGDDNASGLTADAAIKRVVSTGLPVYAVVEGEARRSSQLRKQMRLLAERTGGSSYEAKSPADIEKIFRNIQGELNHLYLLTYRPPEGDKTKWRTIRVEIGGLTGYKVSGKQGYFPE